MKLVRNLRGQLTTKKGKMMVSLTLSLIMSMLIASSAFAATPIDYSPITNALTNSITVTEIATIIGIILGSTLGIALFWWGARKLVKAIVTAFKTGKIKF